MQQIRTTMSIVFWTDTTQEASGIRDAIAAVVPPEDAESTLATISFIESGRPDATPDPPPAAMSNGETSTA